jgi:hypothetical protein
MGSEASITAPESLCFASRILNLNVEPKYHTLNPKVDRRIFIFFIPKIARHNLSFEYVFFLPSLHFFAISTIPSVISRKVSLINISKIWVHRLAMTMTNIPQVIDFGNLLVKNEFLCYINLI